MKIFLYAVISFILCSYTALSAPKSTLVPSKVQKAQIEKFIQEITPQKHPALVIGVGVVGKPLTMFASGYQNLEQNNKATERTQFNIGSVTKQFVAAMVYILQSRGKLSTNDKLSKYFPELGGYSDSITVDHLIHHQSGLKDYLTLYWLRDLEEQSIYSSTFTDAKVLDVLTKAKTLNSAPGAKYSYSNSGYWLLEKIVERITNKPINRFLEEEITKPLGMAFTTYQPKPGYAYHAIGYGFEEDSTWKKYSDSSSVNGGGGIWSTAADLALWNKEIVDHNVLGDEVWKHMLTPGVLNSGDTTTYCGGIETEPVIDAPCISHSGDDANFHSFTGVFTEHNIQIVILSAFDSPHPYEILTKIVPILTNKQQEPKAQQTEEDREQPWFEKNVTDELPTAASLKEMAGYFSINSYVTLQVKDSVGKLHVKQLWNLSEYFLQPIAKNSFVPDGDKENVFVFDKDPMSNEYALTLVTANDSVKTTRIQKLPIDTSASTYAGKYRCEELDTEYTLQLRENKLDVTVNNKNRGTLEFLGNDTYLLATVSKKIVFSKSTDGKQMFTLTHPRAKNMEFYRISQ